MIGSRLREFRKASGWTLKQFGEIIGVSHGSLSDIENEKTKPAADTISSIIRNTDINPRWLLTGRAPPDISKEIDGAESRYFTVTIEGEVAAGPPKNQLYLDFEEELVLPKNLLKRVGGKKISAIRVIGDSMEPELRSGDLVVICKEFPHPKDIDPKRLYCLYVEAEKGFVVKRVKYRPETREFVLLPLNPASSVQFIKLRRGKSPIVGWVVAAWKTHFPEIE